MLHSLHLQTGFLRGKQDHFESNPLKFLTQEKLAEIVSGVDVTSEQIRSYYDTNESLFVEQTFEEAESSIYDMLYQQELQNTFNTWFQVEKEQATVKLFI